MQHQQIINALAGYPSFETLDMTKVEFVDDRWTYKNREFRMTLPPVSCHVRKPEGKNFCTLFVTLDEEIHRSMIDSLAILLAKAKETGKYDPDCKLVLPPSEKSNYYNMILYMDERKLRGLCHNAHINPEDVYNHSSIVTLQVAINQHKPKDGSQPLFQLDPHSVTFEKTFKKRFDPKSKSTSKSVAGSTEFRDRGVDDVFDILTAADAGMEVVEIKKTTATKKDSKRY